MFSMISCRNNRGEMVALPKEKFSFRPSVYGIIRNNGKICVCRNKGNGKLWFPGGGLEQGERREDALRREIIEETGLRNVCIGTLLGVFENFFYYQPTDEAMHAFLFFYECFSEETIVLADENINDDEASDVHWIGIHEIRKEDIGDLQDEIFEMLTSSALRFY